MTLIRPYLSVQISSPDAPTTIAVCSPWMSGFGVMRYDVYLTGYSSLAVAGGDALRLTERGFEPQVVVLPGEVALAKSPGLRLLGSPTAVP